MKSDTMLSIIWPDVSACPTFRDNTSEYAHLSHTALTKENQWSTQLFNFIKQDQMKTVIIIMDILFIETHFVETRWIYFHETNSIG